MGFITPELKQQVVHEVGVRVEDVLDAAKTAVPLIEGRQTAFLEAAQMTELTAGLINKDVDAETLTMDEAKKLLPYLTKLGQQFRQLAVQMANQRNLAAGKVQGLEQAVKLLNNMAEIEKAKAARMVQQATLPTEDSAHRFVGMKERRMSETATQIATDASADASPPVQNALEPAPVQADPVAVESPAESADASADDMAESPKRRGRKPHANNT